MRLRIFQLLPGRITLKPNRQGLPCIAHFSLCVIRGVVRGVIFSNTLDGAENAPIVGDRKSVKMCGRAKWNDLGVAGYYRVVQLYL